MVEQQVWIPTSWSGAAAGLFLGYIWVRFGFLDTLGVGACGLAGYGAATFWRWFSGVFRGEVDVGDQVASFQRRVRGFREP
jgi:hypothetical protein